MKPNLKKVEKNWNTRGFSYGIWTDPPGQTWEEYVHDADELFMVIEGQIELEMKGDTFQPDPGEEIFIPAHCTHSVRNVGKSTSRWLYGYRQS